MPNIAFSSASVIAFDVVKRCLEKESSSDIRRLFQQNGVKVNDEVVGMDSNVCLPATLKIDKRRWFKLTRGGV